MIRPQGALQGSHGPTKRLSDAYPRAGLAHRSLIDWQASYQVRAVTVSGGSHGPAT